MLGDTAYASGETLAALRRAEHRAVIKPWPLQTAVPGGFDRDDFVVDHDAGTATCPAGHTVKITPRLNAVFGAHCGGCTLRERCTTAQRGRTLDLTPHDKELVVLRESWRRGEFKEDYRRFRPMVERAIAWLVTDAHRRGALPWGREEPTRALTSHSRHQPQAPGQPRVIPQGKLDARDHVIAGAQAWVVNMGPPTLRSDIPRLALTKLRLRSRLFNSLLESSVDDMSGNGEPTRESPDRLRKVPATPRQAHSE